MSDPVPANLKEKVGPTFHKTVPMNEKEKIESVEKNVFKSKVFTIKIYRDKKQVDIFPYCIPSDR